MFLASAVSATSPRLLSAGTIRSFEAQLGVAVYLRLAADLVVARASFSEDEAEAWECGERGVVLRLLFSMDNLGVDFYYQVSCSKVDARVEEEVAKIFLVFLRYCQCGVMPGSLVVAEMEFHVGVWSVSRVRGHEESFSVALIYNAVSTNDFRYSYSRRSRRFAIALRCAWCSSVVLEQVLSTTAEKIHTWLSFLLELLIHPKSSTYTM